MELELKWVHFDLENWREACEKRHNRPNRADRGSAI